jgi:hypothetical protein
MIRRSRAAAAASFLLISGCAYFDPIGPRLCAAVVKPAIEVEVRDAGSGQPAATGAVGVLTDGAFADTLRIIGWTHHPSDAAALVLGGAEERPGVYDVRIEKEGYATWERKAVRARAGECGVVTVRLEAHLVRAPG